MSLFTPLETEFLLAHRVGRLATVSAAGQPHVVPPIDPFADGVVRIGARALEGRGQARLYVRHIEANPRIALVIDDYTGDPPRPLGLTVKGAAVIHPEGGELLSPGYGPRWLEITPDWVSSWGIDTGSRDPAVPRADRP